MDKPVKLYHLAASPNSIKARIALAYKKIPYEKIAVDPMNREAVVKLSGQPLTPVMQHGDTVVFDSFAILRYLDANFPSTPRLYSADRDTIKAIEQWEQFARTEPGAAVSMLYGQFRAPSPDMEKVGQANGIFNRAAAKVEEALGRGQWLVGSSPTAADFTVAPAMYYGVVSEADAKNSPAFAFFRKHLKIESAPKTFDWIARVMAWDR